MWDARCRLSNFMPFWGDERFIRPRARSALSARSEKIPAGAAERRAPRGTRIVVCACHEAGHDECHGENDVAPAPREALAAAMLVCACSSDGSSGNSDESRDGAGAGGENASGAHPDFLVKPSAVYSGYIPSRCMARAAIYRSPHRIPTGSRSSPRRWGIPAATTEILHAHCE